MSRRLINWSRSLLLLLLRFLFPGRFVFNNKRFAYCRALYNNSFQNERAVEVPIALDFISGTPAEEILEIGNVLSHYARTNWDTVDKYEKAPKVNNSDIADYFPGRKFARIISISTLEHVGYDEEKKEPDKIKRVIAHIHKDLLSPGGKAMITFPLGYNRLLDQELFAGELGFTREYYLKKISWDNNYKEVKKSEVTGAAYNSPYRYANAICFALIDN